LTSSFAHYQRDEFFAVDPDGPPCEIRDVKLARDFFVAACHGRANFLVRPFLLRYGPFRLANVVIPGWLLIGGGVVRLGRVDLDAAPELGTVLDANARGGDVADYGAIALYVDTIAGVKIANYLSEDDNLPGVNL
jgi:hypothetical protein